jgi:hypothetical protein
MSDGKTFECGACKAVFSITVFARPESMPCLHDPLSCPYCGQHKLAYVPKSYGEERLREAGQKAVERRKRVAGEQ